MSYIEDLEREITATANVAERQRERAKAAEAQIADLRARLEASERAHLTSKASWTENAALKTKLEASERGAAAMREALEKIASIGPTRGGCCSACGAGEDEDCGKNCVVLIARAALARRPDGKP